MYTDGSMSMQILLHSSKTMRRATGLYVPLDVPQLLPQATELARAWKHASRNEIKMQMKLSDKKTSEVVDLFNTWSTDMSQQVPVIDVFAGDIYSGLQAQEWSVEDRAYAHSCLLILSGLYGVLRACDGVMPYRLEMGCKLPDGRTMYQFWGDAVARLLPLNTSYILNLSAVEYTKVILPYVDFPVITPKFLTVNSETGEPRFVTVHAKIARGTFARWIIQNRIENVEQLKDFSELGYQWNASLSTLEQPVFVCEVFDGLGLSVRLTV